MDKDLSIENSGLSESNPFLVPTSQVESQSDLATGLSALQQKEGDAGDHSDSEVVYPVMDAGLGQRGSAILVPDSEVEGGEKQLASDDALVIEESCVSEDNREAALTTSSDEAANVTVIAKYTRFSQEEDDEPMSQDLFQGAEEDDERPVSTPSSHMPSLQLSGQPMLVPETVEESLGDSEVCPSPEAYSRMPLIIPSTPTGTLASQDEEMEYNPGDANTLSSQRQILQSLPASSMAEESASQSQLADKSETGSAGLAGPTLAGGMPSWQQSQSLNLCLTSTSSSNSHPHPASDRQRQSQQGSAEQSPPKAQQSQQLGKGLDSRTQPGIEQSRGIISQPSQSSKGQDSSNQQSQRISQRSKTQSQSKGGLDQSRLSAEFGDSQNLQLYLTQSQKSPQLLSGVSSGPQSEGFVAGQKEDARGSGSVLSSLSSAQESASLPSRTGVTKARVAMSVSMVESQSQSASQTTFNLERPDVSVLGGGGKTQAGTTQPNVFQRTRQGQGQTSLIGPLLPGLTEDSEDFLVPVKQSGKATGVSPSLPGSEPASPSQNSPPQGQVKELEKMESLNLKPEEAKNIFNVDTVMDSESEEEDTQSYDVFPALSNSQLTPATIQETVMDSEPEEEGTQSYDVFPALSNSQLTPAATPAQEVRLQELPQTCLLKQPGSQAKGERHQPTAAGQAATGREESSPKGSGAVRGSQGGSALGSGQLSRSQGGSGQTENQGDWLRSSQSEGRNKGGSQPEGRSKGSSQSESRNKGSSHLEGRNKVSSQPEGRSQGSSQPEGRNKDSSQPQGHGQGSSQSQGHNQGTGSQPQSRNQGSSQSKGHNKDTNSQSQGGSQGSRAPTMETVPEIPGSSPPGAAAVSTKATRSGSQKSVAKDTPAAQTSQDVRVGSRSQPDLGIDKYAFHSSQSQALEGEGEGEGATEGATATSSRPDTSISTLPATKGRVKGLGGRRRKCLVKKKNEVNPRKGAEPKSSSPSADNDVALGDGTRPARKTRKGPKFTRLQKGASDFKRPAPPAHTASKDGDGDGEDNPSVLTTASKQYSLSMQPTLPLSPVRVPVATKKSATTALAPVVVPSTSRAGGDPDVITLRKRKSVEFSDTVHMDSSPTQFSLEQSLCDSQSSDTVMVVTKVTQYVMRFVKQITVVKHVNKDGQVVHEKTTQEEGDPEVIEEIELSKKRRLSIPLSPSRSGSTVTSGDLADISSSSLSKAASSGPSSSLEMSHPTPTPAPPPPPQTGAHGVWKPGGQGLAPWRLSAGLSSSGSTLERGDAPIERRSLGGREGGALSAGVSPALSFPSPNQSSIERDDSRLDAVVTSSSGGGGRGSEPLFSTDNAPSSDLPCAQKRLSAASAGSASSCDVVPPTADESSQQKRTTGLRSPRKSTRRAPADSSQEESKQQTGKASASASPQPQPQSQSQAFLPANESGGFSVASSGVKKKEGSSGSSQEGDRTLRQQVETTRAKRGSGSGSSSAGSQSDHAGVTKPLEASEEERAVETVSKLDIGARVMCRWKDGFFYPAKFVGLNTAIGNKFKVHFEDGMEKVVRAVDLVMAMNLPLGQSVLVQGGDGICDPGMVVRHVPQAAGNQVDYDIAMDDGSTKRCKRSDLLLSEDQASCLLSDEEYRASFGEGDILHVNTADVSLDNVILGKRSRMKGSPAVGIPRSVKPSTSAALSDDEQEEGSPRLSRAGQPQDESETSGRGGDLSDSSHSKGSASRSSTSKGSAAKGSAAKGSAAMGSAAKGSAAKESAAKGSATSSARKRKMGPMATSTPTPKQMRINSKESTPRKATRESFSPLGAAVASPEPQKRPMRRARVGLFDKVKGPIPTNAGLFAGHVFLLTHIQKTANNLADEKQQLQPPATGSSTEDSTDEVSTPLHSPGGDAVGVAFDKDHLKAQIEGGGGTVASQFQLSQVGPGKKLFLVSSSFCRTIKYMQCLAANVPIVSHLWIRDSCRDNQLLAYKDYMLPAGISRQQHRLMERTEVSCLAGQRVMLTSSVPIFVKWWTTVLEAAKVKVLTTFPSFTAKRGPGVNVVVTDHTCEAGVLEKAGQAGVEVVSSEWLIQCLYHNALLPHAAHPMYAHDWYKDVADLCYQHIAQSSEASGQ